MLSRRCGQWSSGVQWCVSEIVMQYRVQSRAQKENKQFVMAWQLYGTEGACIFVS